jgi:hypothetical protein
MHSAARFVRGRVNDNVQVSDGSDVAVQDDGDAANHDIPNLIMFETVKDITIGLWSCHVYYPY